ncbi:hypothetical protein BH09MYX1_BH09MYX1_33400 [soil metagenome]
MPVAMSSQIVDERGASVFKASRSVVFSATEAVLRRSGYHMAFADQAFTVLRTEAIPAGDPAFTSYQRSYNVTLSDVQGGTRVRVAPRMWLNGQDVSGSQVWALEGSTGEYARWDSLFSEIDAALAQLPTQTPAATR